MDKVWGADVTVRNSYYVNPCPAHLKPWLGITWEARPGEIFTNGGPDVQELDEEDYYPQEGLQLEFPWADCGFEPPAIHCDNFPE